MGYKGSHCEYCVLIPEMTQVELVWKHPRDGVGISYCPMCLNVYSMYCCPYIPVFK